MALNTVKSNYVTPLHFKGFKTARELCAPHTCAVTVSSVSNCWYCFEKAYSV